MINGIKFINYKLVIITLSKIESSSERRIRETVQVLELLLPLFVNTTRALKLRSLALVVHWAYPSTILAKGEAIENETI